MKALLARSAFRIRRFKTPLFLVMRIYITTKLKARKTANMAIFRLIVIHLKASAGHFASGCRCS